MAAATGTARHLPTGTWFRVGEDEWAKGCPRCQGERRISQYAHVEGGLCYLCGGSKFADQAHLSTAALDRKERADVRAAERKAAKQAAEAAAGGARWAAEEEVRKAAEAAEAAALAAERAATRHLEAEVGERVTVDGTVSAAFTIEVASYSGWGTDRKRIVAVDLGDGVTVKTFSAAGWAFAARKGDVVRLAGTVKSHGEYDGRKETTLARPRMVEVISRAAGDEDDEN